MTSETNRGILTEKTREFLQADEDERQEDYTRQERYRSKDLIRQRVQNAMNDILLLARELPQEEFQEIFDVEGIAETDHAAGEDHPPWDLSDNPDLAFPYLIEFLLRATDLENDTVFPRLGAEQPIFRDFAKAVARGTQSFLVNQKQMIAEVSVDITLEDARPIDELVEQADDDEEIEWLNRPMALARIAPAIDSEEKLETLIERRDRQREQKDLDPDGPAEWPRPHNGDDRDDVEE